jgi:hypothetical protein
MRVRTYFIAALLAGLSGGAMGSVAEQASGVESEKNLLGSAVANRIVGAWRVNVALGPCGGGPTTISFTAFNTFHAGGTLSDSNARPGSERSPGHGVWEYVGRGLYDTRFQFFRFLPTGALDGVQDITQEVVLDARARSYVTTIRARVLNVDGSLRAELCGTATGQRISID